MSATARARARAPVPVWDPLVRLLHWSLAGGTIVAFATHEWVGLVHEVAGYVALAAAAMRIVWGFAGPDRARFADFVRGPVATLSYARDVLTRRERRFVGHNPLGAWMIVVLLTNAVICGVSGVLLTTDAFFGSEPVGIVHEISGVVFAPLVLLHLAGVIHASLRHRENLVAAMVTGDKRAE